jgi:hypothetical protein
MLQKHSKFDLKIISQILFLFFFLKSYCTIAYQLPSHFETKESSQPTPGNNLIKLLESLFILFCNKLVRLILKKLFHLRLTCLPQT